MPLFSKILRLINLECYPITMISSMSIKTVGVDVEPFPPVSFPIFVTEFPEALGAVSVHCPSVVFK